MRKVGSVRDKENTNLNYLEEVERNILNRRKKNLQGVSAEKQGLRETNQNILRSGSNSVQKLRGYSSIKSTRKLPPGATVTPDQLYSTFTGDPDLNDGKVLSKMAAELSKSRQEIKDLREKLRMLESQQMTVDNLELSKKLDEERKALNNDRAAMLKDFDKKSMEVETERRRANEEKARTEQERIRAKKELDERVTQFELDKLKYKAREDDLRNRGSVLEEREARQALGEKKLGEAVQEVERKRGNLEEFNEELSQLKDKLLEEREKVINEKARFAAEKLELEQDIKRLRDEKRDLDKEKEREMKDVVKRKKELDLREDEQRREKERLAIEAERCERLREKARLSSRGINRSGSSSRRRTLKYGRTETR
jgi:hypothetical protein